MYLKIYGPLHTLTALFFPFGTEIKIMFNQVTGDMLPGSIKRGGKAKRRFTAHYIQDNKYGLEEELMPTETAVSVLLKT